MNKSITRFIWITRAAIYAYCFLKTWSFQQCWQVAADSYGALEDEDRMGPVEQMREDFSYWEA